MINDDALIAAFCRQHGFTEQPRYRGDVREFWNKLRKLTITIDDCGAYEGQSRYQIHEVDDDGCSEDFYDADSFDQITTILGRYP